MPSHQPNIYVFLGSFKREWGPVVRALCLNVAAPSSDPTLTSGLDLLLVASCKLAFLITYPDIFYIPNFFFPDTAIVHTYTANSQANPEIF